MKIIGIILILIGIIGCYLGSMLFGDIGVTAIISGVIGVIAGIGFLKIPSSIKSNKNIETSN